MKSLLSKLAAFVSPPVPAAKPPNPLDYDQWIHLDAESLAEQGIASAYEELLAVLRRYTDTPLAVTEEVDSDAGVYAVLAGGQRYEIGSPLNEPGDSWALATVAFFAIVNASLESAHIRFYAFHGGNDLGGMFLTPEAAAEARAALPRRADWPWLPVMAPPGYGYPGESE